MTRISSSFTFFFKRVFPVLWFGFLAVFLVVMAFTNAPFEQSSIIVSAILVMGIVGFVVFRTLIRDLVDAVYDCGDALLVRNGRDEERIALSRIAAVSEFRWMNPPRITLTLTQPGRFGTEIVFMPKLEFGLPLARYRIAQDLIDRTGRR